MNALLTYLIPPDLLLTIFTFFFPQGAALKGATAESLVASINDLATCDAKDIIEARDNYKVPTVLEAIDATDAKEEVATFGSMVDWDVKKVLRFINSVDVDLFDEVKDKFAACSFDGKVPHPISFLPCCNCFSDG